MRQGQARRAALGALEKTAHQLFILVKGKASNRLIGKTEYPYVEIRLSLTHSLLPPPKVLKRSFFDSPI